MTEEKIKVLITGASGLLGRTIYRYFKDQTYQNKYPINEKIKAEFIWDCLGLCNSRVRGDLKKLDISNFDQVEKVIKEYEVN